jgi:hypothetical protein
MSCFEARFPLLKLYEARTSIYGQLLNGTITAGMNVTLMARSLVDRHRSLRLLNLPLVRSLDDRSYRIFRSVDPLLPSLPSENKSPIVAPSTTNFRQMGALQH